MDDELAAFAQQLQADIFEEAKRELGEKAYQRWRDPLFMGQMSHADGQAAVKGSCGDQMQIYLRFDGDRVAEASFQTDGCGPSVVCASFAAEMAHGKTAEELFEITGEMILSAAGRLPEDHVHCAFLAAETLQSAANDYLIKQTKKIRTSGELLSP